MYLYKKTCVTHSENVSKYQTWAVEVTTTNQKVKVTNRKLKYDVNRATNASMSNDAMKKIMKFFNTESLETIT